MSSVIKLEMKNKKKNNQRADITKKRLRDEEKIYSINREINKINSKYQE